MFLKRISHLNLALTMALLFAMIVTTLAFADTVVPDGDIVSTGDQNIVNLGTVAPGAILQSQVSFTLTCDSKQHVDQGQTISLDFSAQTVPTGGRLTQTNLANPTIGQIPAGWPDDTTGGGTTNCGSPVPAPINDNGNSSLTITAPTAPGTYTYVARYTFSLSPAGDSDNSALKSNHEDVTYTLTVPAPPSDSTPPVITPTISGTLGENEWYVSNVAISWTVTDAESAIISSSGCGPTTITADTTETTLTCTATSAGGTSSQSVTIKRDKTAPVVSCGSADGLWRASDVSIACTATDGGSGLANPADASFSLSTSVPLDTEDANVATGTHSVADAVGNSSTAGPIAGNMIDKKAPQLSGCDSPDGAWYSDDVTLNCHYTDGGSGPATQDIGLTTNVATGFETANAIASAQGTQACDAVGNCAQSPADISGNKVDKKAPTNIAFVGGGISDGGTYYYGFVPAGPTSCTAEDGGSGLSSCNVTGGGIIIGSHSYKATATDFVGNSSPKTLSYIVLAWTLRGFYQPVDMGSVLNTVKNGSTVPLKFEVFAGPTELTATTVVQSFVQTKISCDGSAPQDDIEITTTGGTSLRYDMTSGQFVQNWQTPKLPGQCYRVTMTTQDGSTLSALFKLK